MFLGKKHETEIVLYSYEVLEEEENNTQHDDSSEDETIPYDPECAWCGGPGDAYGSHRICPGHETLELAKLARSRARRRIRS